MSFLTKILTKTITDVIKGVAKLELAVDDLLEKFEGGCPPKEEMLKLVQQKNQIQGALQNINSKFNVVNSTAQTTENIVTAVSTSVKVIKAIPAPTSFPPGFGIPINVITILADALDKLGDLLKGAKGAIKVVPQAAKSITEATSGVLVKLQSLDTSLNECIEEMAQGMTDQERNELIEEINNTAATAGNNVNLNLNVIDEDLLIARLDPNANIANRYLYRKPGFKNADWLLTLEYNPNNEFVIPQRRIRCTNINEFEGNIYRGVTVFNNGDNNAYSYSTSVKVLVDEAQFVIDDLDDNWWKRNNPEFDWPPLYSERDAGAGGMQNQNQQTGSSQAPAPPGPPPPPIEFIGSDPYPIEYPQIINTGNPLQSTQQGQIRINEPSQSIKIIVDTGQNTGFQNTNTSQNYPFGNTNGYYGGTGYGSNSPYYQAGEIGVSWRSNLLDPTAQNQIWAQRQKREYVHVYNEPGEYTFQLKITYTQDLVPTAQPKVYFEGYD